MKFMTQEEGVSEAEAKKRWAEAKKETRWSKNLKAWKPMAVVAVHDGEHHHTDGVSVNNEASLEPTKEEQQAMIQNGTFQVKPFSQGQKLCFDGSAAQSCLAALGITSFGATEKEEGEDGSGKKKKKLVDKELELKKLNKGIDRKTSDCLKQVKEAATKAIAFYVEAILRALLSSKFNLAVYPLRVPLSETKYRVDIL